MSALLATQGSLCCGLGCTSLQLNYRILAGVPIVSTPQPSPERVSGPGPPSSRHRSSNTKVSVVGPSSILVVSPASLGKAVLRARKEAVQEGDGDGRGPFLHRRARAVICWIYTVIHLS